MIKKNGIAFDLDGVLVDYTYRYHQVYHDILKKHGIKCPTRDELITLRKSLPSGKILETLLPDSLPDRKSILQQCSYSRDQMFEEKQYVVKDPLFRGGLERIKEIKKKDFPTALISRRKDKDLLYLQLKEYISLFDFIRVTPKKAEALSEFIDTYKLDSCTFITDSCDDIQEGKKAGVQIIAVLTGLDTKEEMVKMNPHRIVSNVQEYLETL